MSQSSTPQATESTWGRFITKSAATTTQSKLEEAGIKPENITLEEEDNQSPIKLEQTNAIGNLKSGGITGAVLGGLIGLSISLVMTNFAGEGFAALQNFQPIHYFSPIMGAIVGAVGISLILGVTGASAPKTNADINDRSDAERYLLVVKGETKEIALARDIIARQGGVVEEGDRR